MTATTINSSGVHGEAGTGYQGPEDGPFRCSACEYFNRTTNGCSGENMKKLSNRPRLPSGDIEVDAGGCCVYFEGK